MGAATDAMPQKILHVATSPLSVFTAQPTRPAGGHDRDSEEKLPPATDKKIYAEQPARR